MKLTVQRFIAILILVIPGILACIGFLKMKDSLFNYFSQFGINDFTPKFEWGMFVFGFILFAIGIAFIGGWIFYRDRKRNYVAPRFKEKRNKPPKPVKSSKENN